MNRKPSPWKIWRVDLPTAIDLAGVGATAGRVVRVWIGPPNAKIAGGCYFTQTLATERLALTVARDIAHGSKLRKRAGVHMWSEVGS